MVVNDDVERASEEILSILEGLRRNSARPLVKGLNTMAERPTLVDPPIETLLEKVGDSKFTLVAVTAIRAREINEYYNGLGSGHGALIPPQVTSLSNKSLSLAMEELYEGKLQFHRPDGRRARDGASPGRGGRAGSPGRQQ